MEKSKQLQRFLITYMETEVFQELVKTEGPVLQDSLQYVKFIAPTLEDVGTMLASRFSDVQVIGIAAESDVIKSMEKLKNTKPEQTVYVVVNTDKHGNTFTDIVMDSTGVDPTNIISTLTVEEFIKGFEIPINYLESEDTPTVYFNEI